jgi:hypothetical protein
MRVTILQVLSLVHIATLTSIAQQVNQNVNIVVNQNAPTQIQEVYRLPKIIYSKTFSGPSLSHGVLPGGARAGVSKYGSGLYEDLKAYIEYQEYGYPKEDFMVLKNDRQKCEEELSATGGMYFWSRGAFTVRVIIQNVSFDDNNRITDYRGVMVITGP